MFKVTQIKNGVVQGVWFQEAKSSEQAIESVKTFYAKNVRGSRFIAEQA